MLFSPFRGFISGRENFLGSEGYSRMLTIACSLSGRKVMSLLVKSESAAFFYMKKQRLYTIVYPDYKDKL